MKKLKFTDTTTENKYKNGCALLVPMLSEIPKMLNSYGVSFSAQEVKTLIINNYNEDELREMIVDKKTVGNNLEINGLQLDREKVRDMVHLPGLPEIVAKVQYIAAFRHEDVSVWNLIECIAETDGKFTVDEERIRARTTTVLTGMAVDIYEVMQRLAVDLNTLDKIGLLRQEVKIEGLKNYGSYSSGKYDYRPDVQQITQWNGR